MNDKGNLHPALSKTAFVITGNFQEISEITLARLHGKELPEIRVNPNIIPQEISLNSGIFINAAPDRLFPGVVVFGQGNRLITSCACKNGSDTICEHQYETLYNILKREDLRIFFDDKLRLEKIRKYSTDFGMEKEPDLEAHFHVVHKNGEISIAPKDPSLLPVKPGSLNEIRRKLVSYSPPPAAGKADESCSLYIVLRQHKYYRHLFIDLVEARTSKDGKPKNPFIPVNPLDEIWKTEDPQAIKFFTAVSRFQSNIDVKKNAEDIAFLTALIKNPSGIPVYLHNSDVSENISSSSISPVKLAVLKEEVSLNISLKKQFYELTANLKINGRVTSPGDLQIRFNHFIQADDCLFLVRSPALLILAELMKGKGRKLIIHQSKFREFRNTVLNELENSITISHNYIQEASSTQLEKSDFGSPFEKIIYLSDFAQHISIVPVIRYGDVEIPVRTKRQIISSDEKGKEYIVKRDGQEEDRFIALLLKQNPDFVEQLDNPLQYFYLHKKRFLDESWFLKAFDDWDAAEITILGFDEITTQKLNPQTAKVSVQVTSGLNWFNTNIELRFGKKKASLKQLRQSIKGKSKFVRLDDGTMGIIPSDWIEKFTSWFAAGEIVEDTLRTPRVNFASIAKMYDEALLSEEVKSELISYERTLANFKKNGVSNVNSSVSGILRPYQQLGLNWLNCLDDLNFGGCLADDMGLGKTLQIIAFLNSQLEKRGMTTSMVIVPTSLIFNWQAEFEKFAPSLKVHTAYGPARTKSTSEFGNFDVIITSYGTLISDLAHFREFNFNYVFFDESQNIKNPQSQRNMAARVLKSRSKIVITGTPVENNTFDLYGQLSVACPGLLGSLQWFRDVYSSPIDKFGVKKRALELREKVAPFILRRTKGEVATELPEKIEMVVYCEMQPEQRKIYNAYEKEFREFVSSKTDDDLSKTSMYVLKGITRLRQVCDAPVLAGEKGPASATSAKIDTLLMHIEDKSAGSKILVFSQFVGMLDLIKEKLDEKAIRYAYLTGKTKNREAAINEFQNETDVRVFLISLKAGGTGLNLTEASYVYLVDPWWNPAVENQAIDRCYRIGQKKNVVAVRLICPDTVEEKIMKLQQTKVNRVDALIKTGDTLLNLSSKAELLGLLGNGVQRDELTA
ncbi:DEAD/DEAH box helicase family protein [Flavihumibacter sp. R14]|nr:DEAD/DEAH box helicase family protein [Flavihumibacter soli]